MRDLRRLFRMNRRPPPEPQIYLPFGAWENLSSPTIAVCHPDWRGVRTAAYAFGDPVVETRDAGRDAVEIAGGAVAAGVTTLVIHGFPVGSASLFRAAKARGLTTRSVMHSSMAQHGSDDGESEMMDAVVELSAEGIVDRVGFVKAGMAEAFRALGIDADHTPNRTPVMPKLERAPLEGGHPHIGVFGVPYWRKNIVTQLGAAAVMGGTAHVTTKPAVAYLEGLPIVEHGELVRDRFLAVQASTDINLYVTLSECHPMAPIESYLSGVPALVSRTSDVFRSDAVLWDLTTVDEPDNPTTIASSARRLMEHSDEAVERARGWIQAADAAAERAWGHFLQRPRSPEH